MASDTQRAQVASHLPPSTPQTHLTKSKMLHLCPPNKPLQIRTEYSNHPPTLNATTVPGPMSFATNAAHCCMLSSRKLIMLHH
ncbi:hypothetical protein EJ03DRAFT_326923 [Teratosphaeria nubilosa]|uniref:Uncharacterized protein n=1 Tax=Teratosphaeria nubilosa TaxID=161662 RepID=A0A6G1LBP4_9PEZI|nr:hypothetical protein EJ03DRAFT_326923 [Teratosphaeria nubilosa]